MIRWLTTILTVAVAALSAAAQTGNNTVEKGSASQQKRIWEQAIADQKAWTVSDILADRYAAEVDTVMENYCQKVAIPHLQFGTASAITGNLGGSGQYMNYFERPEGSDFFFNDAYHPYMPRVDNTPFFNTRVPMTLVSFNTGGSSQTTQDWLKARLSGNINKAAQVGAWLSYLYSRGMYESQSGKHFNWGLNGSYLGERYQMMAMFNNWNIKNYENGGIEDDLYITDPAAVQGGSSSIGTKQIPVNLDAAQAQLSGHQLWMINRYRMGFEQWNEVDSVMDFVPASQLFWTFNFRMDQHRFTDASAFDNSFYPNTYFGETTEETTKQWYIRNAVGIELLEGFKKWVKFGLAAYAMHEVARYQQADYYGERQYAGSVAPKQTENSLFVGGRLNKTTGALIRYDADARVGLAGVKAGEVYARGNLDFRFGLKKDTALVRAYVDFSNRKPSYFLRNYVSNHYIWENDFGKTRKLRFGGTIDFPLTRTTISAGMENVQNLVYFNAEGVPEQYGGNVQIFSASIDERLQFGIWHWDNKVTYQKSSNQHVVPLPELTVYSNMYLLFRVATLRAQVGVDCTYMTRYSALGYNPAVSTFTNQWDGLVGNYPMCDAYANLKLKKVKFYVLYSHFNQGLFGGSNYFSALHYPLNPHRFLFGLCVDFAN
ncbi:MAG: putative porin [Bacteroides sp.]|nr:putative porin [Bacteroides sp.]MCM1378886.1 putative porin [Bacteroides sp.]MCM1445502.1 putative porin [Prevotella sp.]